MVRSSAGSGGMPRNPFKRYAKPVEVFTGNCMVRLHTGDGNPVGPCWHSTYNGVCPSCGDVTAYLPDGRLGLPWPADYQLPKYDGTSWAERLRTRQANNKKGNGS